MVFVIVTNIYQTSDGGVILSPNFPDNYNIDQDVYWTITAPEGKIIRVDFEELDIENEVSCRDDYLRFYDGESKTDREIRTFCGTSQPYPIQTTSNKLYIHFHSNEQYSRKGFRLTWKAIDVATTTVSTTTPYPRGTSLTALELGT